jgi:NitT/TauT family transport system permease protein
MARSGQLELGPLRVRRAKLVRALRLLLGLVLLAGWETASGRWMDAFWLSSPSQIALRSWIWLADGSLLRHGVATIYVIALGMAIGLVPGIAAGMLLGGSRFLNRLLAPFLVFLYCIPLIALAPLLILWFGLGLLPKVIIVAVIVFFLLFFNVVTGVAEVDPDLGDGVLIMGGSRTDVARKVMLPAALPWVAAGVRIAVPYAVVGAVVGEMIVSNEGLGYLIKNAASVLDATGAFTSIIVLTLISVSIDLGVKAAERRFLGWSPQAQAGADR